MLARGPRWLDAGSRSIALCGVVLWCCLAQGVRAEVVVNQITRCSQDDPSVDVAPDGSFVVVWETSGGCDGVYRAVRGRRFDAAGLPLGDEFGVEVASEPVASTNPAQVGVAADGRFVVVFPSLTGIQARLYDAAGMPLGDDFRVSMLGTSPIQGDLAVAPDGSFVAVFSDNITDTVLARRFDASGTALGPAFVVANVGSGLFGGRVGVAADGRFVVAWRDGDIYAQRYDAMGSADGAIIQLNSDGGYVDNVDLAVAPDGSFVAVWDHSVSMGQELRGRRFDATGAALGGEFVVGAIDRYSQSNVDVAPDGSFIVGYQPASGDGDGNGIAVRRYDAPGSPLGSPIQANDFETGEQVHPGVGAGPDGRAVVVWSSDILDGYDEAVVAQRLRDGIVDQPVAGTKLLLKRRGAKETLVFLSKRDPQVPFPPIGSTDDPATGTPGGVLLELFSPAEGTAQLPVPPGLGSPGWTARQKRLTDSYRFLNHEAPAGPTVVKVLSWKARRLFKGKARGVGLALGGPQTAIGIRITAGTRRFCALFDGATIKRDEADLFVAAGAPAGSLPDCTDATLNGLL